MGTFGDSWKLTKTAFRLIKEDKSLLAFPAVAGACYIGVLALFLVGFVYLLFYAPIDTSSNAFFAVIIILFVTLYFVLWIIGTFFTAGLVGAAMLKLKGGQPTFSDGMKVAKAHWEKIVIWALFAGTVGLIIQVITSRFKGLPALIIGLAAEATWGLATYFIMPVLLFEDKSTWASLKHSAGLFIHNFGRTIVSNIALALIVGAGIFGAFILGIIGVYLLFTSYVIIGAAVIVAAIVIGIIALLIASAAEGILVTALYRYATEGKIEEDLVHPDYTKFLPNPKGDALPSSGFT
jgi:hypothetical protein